MFFSRRASCASASRPRFVPAALGLSAAVLLAGSAWWGGEAHAADTGPASGHGWVAPLVSPVEELQVLAFFDRPARRWLAGHRGIDLRAEEGSPVRSPGEGVVVFVGRVVNRGVVTVSHGDLRSSLEPVDATVALGDEVAAGSVLGTVGSEAGHCAPVACVHWGVRWGDEYLDPLDVLAGFGPVGLLPDA